MLNFPTDWYCPNCGLQDRTTEARPHQRMHNCPRLHGLTAPMLHAGTKAKVEAHLREDFVADEVVAVSPVDGKPYMSVVTTRDDGQDAIVFAPTAKGFIR